MKTKSSKGCDWTDRNSKDAIHAFSEVDRSIRIFGLQLFLEATLRHIDLVTKQMQEKSEEDDYLHALKINLEILLTNYKSRYDEKEMD